MLYIINDNGIDGSFWYYRGAMTEMKSSWPGYVSVPTMISKYPYDFAFTQAPQWLNVDTMWLDSNKCPKAAILQPWSNMNFLRRI